jgi:type IV pilus assembly protein PilV
MKNYHRQQEGVFLLEALIAILIFSIGILGIVALGATAVSAQSDAQYRTEAARVADNIISAIWLGVDRGNTAATQPRTNAERQALLTPSLAVFNHQATGAEASCNFSGSATTDPTVTALITALTTGTTALPGARPERVQVRIFPPVAGVDNNEVLVTVCWQAPSDAGFRRYSIRSFIN